jgi:hypothetical protein
MACRQHQGMATVVIKRKLSSGYKKNFENAGAAMLDAMAATVPPAAAFLLLLRSSVAEAASTCQKRRRGLQV